MSYGAWIRMVGQCDLEQCAMLHGVLIGAIHDTLNHRDHPIPRYRELINLELVVIRRVESLGGYSNDLPKG